MGSWPRTPCTDGGTAHLWEYLGREIRGNRLRWAAQCHWCGRKVTRNYLIEPGIRVKA